MSFVTSTLSQIRFCNPSERAPIQVVYSQLDSSIYSCNVQLESVIESVSLQLNCGVEDANLDQIGARPHLAQFWEARGCFFCVQRRDLGLKCYALSGYW